MAFIGGASTDARLAWIVDAFKDIYGVLPADLVLEDFANVRALALRRGDES